MSVVEELKAIQHGFADESMWTKGASARTAGGEPVMAKASTARCFCLLGMMVHLNCSADTYESLMHSAKSLGFFGVAQLNDSGGFSKVHECLDLAIATAEKEQGE